MNCLPSIRKDPGRAVALLASSFGLFAYLHLEGASTPGAAAVAIALLLLGTFIWVRETAVFGDEPARAKPKKSTFDWGMHYMRGFAIVCIMLMHVQARLGHRGLTRSFFSASTVFFLFISGYLCQYLAMKKPVVDRDYYSKKGLNVILPYLLCSLVTMFLVWLTGRERIGVISPGDIGARGIAQALVLGKAQDQYWYIPFVTVLFAISPALTRLSLPALVWCTIVAFFASLVFPSRYGSFLSFNIVVSGSKFTFFTVYYLIGFLYARLKEQIDPYLKTYVIPALLFALILGIHSLRPGLFPMPVLKTDTFKTLQKLFFLIPVLFVAGLLKHRRVRVLDAFAEYSFTLFFLHYFFVQDYVALQHRLAGQIPRSILAPVLIVLFIGQNLVLSVLLKKAFGRWSRSLIGS